MYFIQFSMLQMKERAKFMPENKVFGQAEGGRIWGFSGGVSIK